MTASVVGASMLAVVALGAATVGLTTTAFQARSHAQGTADLAAIAGAHVARDSRALGAHGPALTSPACDAAAQVAHRNAAQLATCTVSSDGAVTVSVRVVRGPWEVERSSRAGTG